MEEAAADQPKRSIVKHERITITKRTLDALKAPATDVVLWDKSLRSFGVRLSPAGAITFLVQYRNAQGRSRRITIGPYGAYTPHKARQEAERLLGEAKAARHGWDDAKDPAERRREERTAITFRQLSVEYMEKAEKGLVLSNRSGRAKKPGTVAIDKYRMAHLVRHFGDKLVKNIDRGDCQRCLEMLIAGKHGAARTYGFLGGVLTYAVGQGYISTNPARGVPTPADRRRNFKLDVSGYRALGKALEAAEARCEPWQAIGAIRLIALAGLRKSEAQRLRLREIDLAGHCLRYDDTKAGEDMPQNVRPLGKPALELLDALMRRGGRPRVALAVPRPEPEEAVQRPRRQQERLLDSHRRHCLQPTLPAPCLRFGMPHRRAVGPDQGLPDGPRSRPQREHRARVRQPAGRRATGRSRQGERVHLAGHDGRCWEGSGMIAPVAPDPNELSDGILEEMLRSLKVPEGRLSEAAPTLRQILTIAHIDHAIASMNKTAMSKRKAFSEELKDLARVVAPVRAKIDELSAPARTLLALKEGSVAHSAISLLIDRILAASATFRLEAAKSGRPRKQSPFDSLVLLLYFLAPDTGWRVSVEPEKGTGTLVDFLALATRYLPNGFVPRALCKGSPGGWKRLQLIGTAVAPKLTKRKRRTKKDEAISRVMAKLMAKAAATQRGKGARKN